ncbi:hypothetical protein AgCh_017602 [Apium graveolens]
MLKFVVVAEITKRTEFVVVAVDKREVLNEDEEGVPKAGMEVVGVANGFRLEFAGVADGIRLEVWGVANSSNNLAGKQRANLLIEFEKIDAKQATDSIHEQIVSKLII